jgi:hypothetical protein
MYLSNYSFTCDLLGWNTDTLFMADASGNTSFCISAIEVIDTIRPIAFAKDTVLYLDEMGFAQLDGSWLDSASSDNCQIDTLLLSQWEFTCDDLGLISDTLSVVDQSGNVSIAIASIMVKDTIKPSVSCLDTTVLLNSEGFAELDVSFVLDAALDACTLDTVYLSKSSFNCSSYPTDSLWVIAVDGSGNMDSCRSYISVLDTIAPQISCFDTTLYLNEEGWIELFVPPESLNPVENCSIAAIELSDTLFSCANTGVNAITVTAFDAANQSGTCQMNVAILDTLPPVALCIDTTVYLNAEGVATIDESFVNNSSFDNCEIATFLLSQYNFDESDLGFLADTLWVTDFSGNTAYCLSTLEIVNEINTSIDQMDSVLCYGDSTASIQMAVTGGIPPYTYIFDGQENDDGYFGNLSAESYTYKVFDAYGLEDSGTFEITEPDSIWVDQLLSQAISCYGFSDGSLFIDAQGGSGTLSYEYNGILTTDPTITGLNAGLHMLKISDENGCWLDTSVVFQDPDSLYTTLESILPITCHGFQNGEISVQGWGGTGALQFIYSGDTLPGNAASIGNLGSGTHTITVLDNNGCETALDVWLEEPDSITLSIQVFGIDCFGENDGVGVVEASGGSGSFTYAWNNSTNDLDDTTQANLAADQTYTITVADVLDENCFVMDQITPDQPEKIAFDLTPMSLTCDPQDRGVLVELISGGYAPFQFAIGDLDTALFSDETYFDNLEHQAYTFHVKDSNDCYQSKVQIPYNPNVPYAEYELSTRELSVVDASIEFTDLSNYHQEVHWDFGDGVTLSGALSDFFNEQNTQGMATNPTHQYIISGLMTTQLIVTSGFGCTDTMRIEILVEEDHRIFLPNAFTPNGDGKNDVFNIVGYNLFEEDFYMRIF